MNRSMLKWIALITMTIDHVGYFLLDHEGAIYLLSRSIGRIAFPIFAFLIAEGFMHTRNFWNYLKRILIVGFIFECALIGAYFITGHNLSMIPLGSENAGQINIMWTLANGLIGLYIIKKAHVKYQWLILPVVFVSLFLSYSFYGLGLIMIFGLLKDNQAKLAAMISLTALYSTLPFLTGEIGFSFGSIIQILALLSLPIIFLYNGKKGKDNPWFFYLYYPLHLIVLIAINYYII